MTRVGNIEVRHPLPGDLVGPSFGLAGLGSGFEGDLCYRVTTGTGEVIADGHMRGGAYSMREFQAEVELNVERVDKTDGRLEVFWPSPADPEEDPLGPERDTVVVPIVFGFRVLDDFVGVAFHEVKEGETLTSIAEQHFTSVTPNQIFEANRDVLSDPDVIHPGQILRIPGSL